MNHRSPIRCYSEELNLCVQTEAYYAMKQQAEKSWRQAGLEHQEGWHTFTPCTNVQWIAYLAKVLRYKKYPKAKGSKETYKGVSMTREEKSSLDAFMCVFQSPLLQCSGIVLCLLAHVFEEWYTWGVWFFRESDFLL